MKEIVNNYEKYAPCTFCITCAKCAHMCKKNKSRCVLSWQKNLK
ncbi:hypothetical protein [Methanobrevibacter sp.]|nr:hypothetical protein [uncultured Methanobrevibacter sp.]